MSAARRLTTAWPIDALPEFAHGDARSERVLAIQSLALFQDLHHLPNALETLAYIMTERRFFAQQDIVVADRRSDELFILVSGSASLSQSTAQGDVFKVGYLERLPELESRTSSETPSPIFGETHLIDGFVENESPPAPTTLRAETDCVFLVLSRSALGSFAAHYPEWALPIYRRLAAVALRQLTKSRENLNKVYNAFQSEIRGRD